jgi:7-cyano-7-deazaguanine synthase
MSKALVILSGGQDSTTCLFWAKERFTEVHAVTFDYGQRHRIEVESAIKIARRAGVMSHEVIELGPILLGTSPLVNRNEQVESYADAATLPGGIEKTFVPMRNTLFFTIAANRAVVLGLEHLVTGICQEDFGGYPDCREYFRQDLEKAFATSLEGIASIQIHAPLMNLNKAETVEMAVKNGAYGALAWSHTCYNGEFPPCGKCHACLLRARGFEEAEFIDPLLSRAQPVINGNHPA